MKTLIPCLKTLSTTALFARMARLETAIRFADARSAEAGYLAEAWTECRDELDSRATCAVLAAV